MDLDSDIVYIFLGAAIIVKDVIILRPGREI